LGVFPLCKNSDGEIKAVKNRRSKRRAVVVDHCIWMKRFPTNMRLDRVLERGEVQLFWMQEFGHRLAQLQGKARRINKAQGNKRSIADSIMENLEQLEQTYLGKRDIARISRIRSWLTSNLQRLSAVIKGREERGMIRELHADLHSRNLYLEDNQIQMFDCLEFSDDLARIDVANDVAFLFMDLLVRKRADLAWAFVDAWLEETGDYEALKVLRIFTTYRALVRCKIAALSTKNKDDTTNNLQEYERYLSLSEDLIARQHGTVIAMCGKSGSGKSYWSRLLVPAICACKIRSDVERKRLFSSNDTEEDGTRKRQHLLYSDSVTDETYSKLNDAVRAALDGKVTLIVDASYLSRQRRIELSKTVSESDSDAACIFVVCTADEQIMRNRVLKRSEDGTDISDATVDVLNRQTMDDFIEDDGLRKIELHTDGPDETKQDVLNELIGKLKENTKA
jgi:aminoglycoside phosphotransferase family enzyme/predicted kinase